MRLCTVSTRDLEPFFGISINGKILRIREAAEACKMRRRQCDVLADMMTYLRELPYSEKALRTLLKAIAEEPRTVKGKADDEQPFIISRDHVLFHPPVLNPRKVLCIGLNYREHCEEQGAKLPKFPIVFNKYPTSLIGHGAEIPLPLKYDDHIDYEVELAFVIGEGGKEITKRGAMKHIAGYMVMNDVSARNFQETEKQWSRAKGFDGSGPCGPFLVTPDEVGNPHDLDLKCWVNGKLLQSSTTRNLIFQLPHLIKHISEVITLEPGDIVTTGTPSGVGFARTPPIFLKPGDVVECEVERVGRLRNVCVEA